MQLGPDQDGSPERLARERSTVAAMIVIYCRGHHGSGTDLCGECRELMRLCDAPPGSLPVRHG